MLNELISQLADVSNEYEARPFGRNDKLEPEELRWQIGQITKLVSAAIMHARWASDRIFQRRMDGRRQSAY